MFRVQATSEVDRPPADVSAFLSDLGNEPKWQPGIVHLERLAGEPGQAGARWERVQEVGGRKIKTEVRLVGHEPGARVAFEGVGKVIKVNLEYRLSPSGSGTRVEMELEGEMLGFASMFEGMAAEAMQKDAPKGLERLKQALTA